MKAVEFTHAWVDLEKYAETGHKPAGIVPRERDEEWQVMMTPIVFDRPMEWNTVKDGEAVYVPLIPYRVSIDPEEAFTFLVATGVMAGIRVSMARSAIRRIHVIRGRPVEDLRPEADAFRFWVGLAIQIK